MSKLFFTDKKHDKNNTDITDKKKRISICHQGEEHYKYVPNKYRSVTEMVNLTIIYRETCLHIKLIK